MKETWQVTPGFTYGCVPSYDDTINGTASNVRNKRARRLGGDLASPYIFRVQMSVFPGVPGHPAFDAIPRTSMLYLTVSRAPLPLREALF